jgi:hypothetical protein
MTSGLWAEWAQFVAKTGALEAPIRAFMLLTTEAVGHDATPSQAVLLEGRAQAQLVWDSSRYHFDVDLLADGTLEWFFSDRTTKIPDGGEDLPQTEGLPPQALEYLRIVIGDRFKEMEVAS